MTLAFIDTETGGLTTDTSLLDVAVVITDDKLMEIDHFSMKVRPVDSMYRVHPRALEVNGINLVAHERLAKQYNVAAEALIAFLEQHNNKGKLFVPAGWNVQFDEKFVRAYLLRGELWDTYFTYRHLDGQSALKFLQVQGKMPDHLGSLASCAKHFGLSEQAHTALADCYCTIEVVRKLLNV
jgi:oligoribonuclease (3'-5' exoribonuclease)